MKERPITIGGMKVKPSEIRHLTIERDGHEITITPKPRDERPIGFKQSERIIE